MKEFFKIQILFEKTKETEEFKEKFQKLLLLNQIFLEKNWNFKIINYSTKISTQKLYSGILFYITNRCFFVHTFKN